MSHRKSIGKKTMQTSRISDLIDQATQARKEGATNFEIEIVVEQNGKTYYRWIDYYRNLSDEEMLDEDILVAQRVLNDLKKRKKIYN